MGSHIHAGLGLNWVSKGFLEHCALMRSVSPPAIRFHSNQVKISNWMILNNLTISNRFVSVFSLLKLPGLCKKAWYLHLTSLKKCKATKQLFWDTLPRYIISVTLFSVTYFSCSIYICCIGILDQLIILLICKKQCTKHAS